MEIIFDGFASIACGFLILTLAVFAIFKIFKKKSKCLGCKKNCKLNKTKSKNSLHV